MRSPILTAQILRSFVQGQGFLLGVAAIVGALMVLGAPARDLLSLDFEAVGRGQVWRLLTGHFVHLSPYHALLNVIGLFVYMALCPQLISAREWAIRWLVLCALTGIGLYVWVDDLNRYLGLSGVIHGLFFLGLWPLALRRDPVAIIALMYLLGKLIWEQAVGVPLSDQQAIGGPVVTESHLLGTLAAVAYAILFRKFRTGERST